MYNNSLIGLLQNTQVVRCLICHMSFPTELDMQLHLATHGKQFQCTLCPQSFHIEYLLDKHMQNHHSSPVIDFDDYSCGLQFDRVFRVHVVTRLFEAAANTPRRHWGNLQILGI